MAKIQPPIGTRATVQTLVYRGATYELRLVCCNRTNCSRCNAEGRMRPTHGPYWYLCYTSRGRTCRVYMGKNLNTSLYRDDTGRISVALIKARPRRSRPSLPQASNPPAAEASATVDVPESRAPRARAKVVTPIRLDPHASPAAGAAIPQDITPLDNFEPPAGDRRGPIARAFRATRRALFGKGDPGPLPRKDY